MRHGSVPIYRAVARNTFSIVVLRRVAFNGEQQEALKGGNIRDKLRVRALHEAYGLHFFQRDGLHLRHKGVEFIVKVFHLDFANIRKFPKLRNLVSYYLRCEQRLGVENFWQHGWLYRGDFKPFIGSGKNKRGVK